MRKLIGVYTRDFEFFHKTREVLKSKGIPFVGIAVGEEIPEEVGVVVTSTDEVDDVEFEPRIGCDSVKDVLGKVLCTLMGKSQIATLTIGVDPGPRPGLAVLADGSLLETRTAGSPEDVAQLVEEAERMYSPRNSRIRIGHGDTLNRNRIINSLLERDYSVEMVDEKGTTVRVENPDLEAARRIASSSGTPVREILDLAPTPRQLKEIQRQSRIASGNRITISTELARDVAVGRLTLQEALRIQERKD